MGPYPFTVNVPRRERPLADALASFPRAFREQAQKGFRILAGLGREHHAVVIDALSRTLEGKEPPLEQWAKGLALSTDEMSEVLAAAMIAVPLVHRGTADEFASAAVKAGLLPTEMAPSIVPFAESVIAERLPLARLMRRRALPSQVLPFLARVDIVVDVRMDFENQEVYETVPVAICHIDTNVETPGLWFQASKSQMERLRNDIDEAIKRMETAEAWARRDRAT